jgi:hypothetical protein
MTDARIAPARSLSGSVLNGAAGLWLAVALIGQWAFAWYIANFYGPPLASGNYEGWSALAAMGAKAYVPGDDAGIRLFGAHALAAGFVALGGALQLMPFVRKRWPTFHRWNGRVFLLTVVGLSLTGLWLIWVRKTGASGPIGRTAITINALLILGFAGLALRAAMARRFDIHERWATRLYLVSNAQWFTRVGLFGYFVANMALGARPSMDDPFLTFWTFGCYLVPLGVAELYLWARGRGGTWARLATAVIIVAMTLYMAAGAVAFGLFSMRLLSGAPMSLPG